jgi:hypothetical protein
VEGDICGFTLLRSITSSNSYDFFLKNLCKASNLKKFKKLCIGYRTGLVGKKNVAPDSVYPFDFEFYDQLNCIPVFYFSLFRQKKFCMFKYKKPDISIMNRNYSLRYGKYCTHEMLNSLSLEYVSDPGLFFALLSFFSLFIVIS